MTPSEMYINLFREMLDQGLNLAPSASALAESLGIAHASVRHLITGDKSPTLKLCLRLEAYVEWMSLPDHVAVRKRYYLPGDIKFVTQGQHHGFLSKLKAEACRGKKAEDLGQVPA